MLLTQLRVALAATCLAAGFALPVHSGGLFDKPGIMAGIAFDFSGAPSAADFGFTIKALSNRRENSFVLGAGVSYFPWATESKFGLDAGAGYNFRHGAVLGGYDVLRNKPQVSAGWAYTRRPAPRLSTAPSNICATHSDCSAGSICQASVCVPAP